MARSTAPLAPRISAPDLPPQLGLGALTRAAHIDGALVEGLTGSVDAPHAHLVESVVRGADVDRLDLGGSALSDVELDELRGVDLSFREARWQSVRMTGGRIGTLDLSRADLTGVRSAPRPRLSHRRCSRVSTSRWGVWGNISNSRARTGRSEGIRVRSRARESTWQLE